MPDQQVFGLEVAVDDVLGVAVTQGVRHLFHVDGSTPLTAGLGLGSTLALRVVLVSALAALGVAVAQGTGHFFHVSLTSCG